jgi:hypothetical protein
MRCDVARHAKSHRARDAMQQMEHFFSRISQSLLCLCGRLWEAVCGLDLGLRNPPPPLLSASLYLSLALSI